MTQITDLHINTHVDDHDAICTAQASQLLKLGYLEYELACYGTAYYQNNEITYFISSKEDTIKTFWNSACLNGISPLPIKYFVKRYDILSGMEETVTQNFRIDVAQMLQQNYPPIIYEALTDLTAPYYDNVAFAWLSDLTKQLDGCFDINRFNLFSELIHMLLRARLLTKEGYAILQDWVKKEYEKIAIEPVASGYYKRTYAGFAYQKPTGDIAYFSDAFPYMTHEKHIALISQGVTVTPILTITYYADSFNTLSKTKKQFDHELRTYLDEMYMRLMNLLKTLPTAIDGLLYQQYLAKIKKTGSTQGYHALLYYGHLWNVFSTKNTD